MISKILFSVVFFSVFFNSNASACTGILLEAKDGSLSTGRTVEFEIDLDMSVAVIPRDFGFVGTTPKGEGMAYKSKYASAGVFCFGSNILMDGINEKGLAAAAFYFPGYASYAACTEENQKSALSPIDFTNWILSQFASLEEVKEGVKSVAIVPTVIKEWGSAPPPMHYIVYDKTGKSLVIEPLEGSLKVYDNPIGVITNSPTFDWHIQNLNNFMNLSPLNVEPKKLRGLELKSFGQGSGMVGLPGDFSPPSRFVRAAIFSVNALVSENLDQLVDQTFHILNLFDIPKGAVQEEIGNKKFYDYTPLTVVRDIKSMKYFYKSYKDQAIKFIDLSAFDLNEKSIKSMKIEGEQKRVDQSSLLK
jgi:choloylglycine hydrolase